MSDIIQIRRDIEDNWKNYNPLLAEGELVVTMDTIPQKIKIGDGKKTWVDIPYLAGLEGKEGVAGKDGKDGTAILTPNTATDEILGDRTVDLSTVTSYSLKGSLTKWLTWFTKRFEEVTGWTWGKILPCSLKKLWEIPWTESFLIPKAVAGYISPVLPITGKGLGVTFKFVPQGIPTGGTWLSVYSNNTKGCMLASPLTSEATTLTLTSPLTYPSSDVTNAFYMIDVQGKPEVIRMTGGNGTSTVTVARGQLGTTAVAHTSSDMEVFGMAMSSNILSNNPVTVDSSGWYASKGDRVIYALDASDSFKNCSILCLQEWVNVK